LAELDYLQVVVGTQIGERLWNDEEKINYYSTPMFMLVAYK